MNQHSILVVDDELLIRDLLYDFFTDQGWDISIAESGEKALEILRSKKIDLVLTDLKMPNMDGLMLTSEVRESYPDIPVVIMTGYPSVDSAVSALRQKVSDYIIKPFNINELYKVVEEKIKETQG
ncbi:MAG: response regulator [Candidatus Zixiibacteriota bacterium]|jgi:DNA-binding NtrC family response regulator|nr:MAG: response regulator [candidate division Zixibacteria bacterium]